MHPFCQITIRGKYAVSQRSGAVGVKGGGKPGSRKILDPATGKTMTVKAVVNMLEFQAGCQKLREGRVSL